MANRGGSAMKYDGTLVGYSAATVRKIPRAQFERWKMLLRKEGKTVEQRLLELLLADLGENWNEELEARFRETYGLA